MWKPFGVSSPFEPGNDNTSLILGMDISLFSVRKLSHTCIDETEETQSALSSSISTRNSSIHCCFDVNVVCFRATAGKSMNLHVTERLGKELLTN